jgi:hypothetical protein
MMQMSAILLKASPRVLGNEINATFLISVKSILKENLGVKPQLLEASA